MHSWTRVRGNGAFGAHPPGFIYCIVERSHFGYISKPVWIHLGDVSMHACVALGSGSQVKPPSVVPRLMIIPLGGASAERILARNIFFFELQFFSRIMLRSFPRIFGPSFLWVQKITAKFPPNLPPTFPPKILRNNRRASAGAQG